MEQHGERAGERGEQGGEGPSPCPQRAKYTCTTKRGQDMEHSSCRQWWHLAGDRGEASHLIHRCHHLFLLVSLTLDTMLEQYFTLSFLKFIVISWQWHQAVAPPLHASREEVHMLWSQVLLRFYILLCIILYDPANSSQTTRSSNRKIIQNPENK